MPEWTGSQAGSPDDRQALRAEVTPPEQVADAAAVVAARVDAGVVAADAAIQEEVTAQVR